MPQYCVFKHGVLSHFSRRGDVAGQSQHCLNVLLSSSGDCLQGLGSYLRSHGTHGGEGCVAIFTCDVSRKEWGLWLWGHCVPHVLAEAPLHPGWVVLLQSFLVPGSTWVLGDRSPATTCRRGAGAQGPSHRGSRIGPRQLPRAQLPTLLQHRRSLPGAVETVRRVVSADVDAALFEPRTAPRQRSSEESGPCSTC